MDRRILIGAVLTLIIAVAVPVYWTRESTRKSGVESELEMKSLEQGAAFYVTHCASCHGDYGEGTADGSPLRGTTLETAEIVRATAEGVEAFPSTQHVYDRDAGGPLDAHEIADIAFFIKNWDAEVLSEARGDVRQVDVEVSEFAYEPAEITVQVGEPVRLNFVNVGQLSHAWRMEGGEVELVDGGEIEDVFLEMEPGESAAVEFISLEAGTLTFYCPLPEHADRGEVGTVVMVD